MTTKDLKCSKVATLNSDILHGARGPSLLRSNINLLKYTSTIDNTKLHVDVQYVKPGWFSSFFGSRTSRIKVMFKLICHMRCISVFTKVLNLSSPNDGQGQDQGHSNREFSSLTPISNTFKAKQADLLQTIELLSKDVFICAKKLYCVH